MNSAISQEFGLRTIVADVLVIGGGAAGSRAAVSAAAAGAKTVMVLKGELGTSGSTCFPARGPHGSAYQAADGCSHEDGDSPDIHFQDILTAGLGMADPRLARILADEAPARLRELIAWGFVPDPEPEGERCRAHWAGYSCFASKPRAHGIWDVSAGHAGALVQAAAGQIKQLDVEVIPHILITDLLVQDGECAGALGIDPDGNPVVFRTAAVILGAGGAGQLFPAATAAHEATGDGYGLALRAGAELVNMEFMQFMVRPMPDSGPIHWMLAPTIRNMDGEDVLERYLPSGVDPVAAFEARTVHYPFSIRDPSGWIDIAIRSEALAGRGDGKWGALVLDYENPRSRSRAAAGARPRPQHHWPGPNTGPVPFPEHPGIVRHSAHAINGGVYISTDGESSLPGLYAAGESAAGAHGADRLGGNMLPNCQVFGHRSGVHAAGRAWGGLSPLRGETLTAPVERLRRFQALRGEARAKDLKLHLQELNAKGLYVVRSTARLATLLEGILQLKTEELPQVDASERRGLWHTLEVDNMLLTAEVMARAALIRKESRGSHFREDYPKINDELWRVAIFQQLKQGQPTLRTASIEGTSVAPIKVTAEFVQED